MKKIDRMRYFLLISLLLTITACNNNGEKTNTGTGDSITLPAVEQKEEPLAPADKVNDIEDSLMKLPFIRESNRYIDSLSGHQRGIAFMRDTADGMINIRAGYNGPDRFETYYDFSIDPVTNEIKLLDPVLGDYITLKEYLKKNMY